MADLIEIAGVRILFEGGEGPRLATEDEAADLVGAALSEKAQAVAVSAERLAPAFFSLKTGVAGAVIQKIVNYRLKFVVVGDVSAFVRTSPPLADFIRESNRGRDVFFVPDIEAAAAKLASLQGLKSDV